MVKGVTNFTMDMLMKCSVENWQGKNYVWNLTMEFSVDLYTMGCSLKLECHNFESHSPGLEPHISYYFLGIKGNPRSANLLLESIDDGKTDVSPTSSNPKNRHKDATSLFHGSTVWWLQPGPLVHLVLLDAVWNTKSTNSASEWPGKLKTHPKGSWNGTWGIIPRIVPGAFSNLG